MTPDSAARLILDGDTLAVGGFVGIAVPEELIVALEERFCETGGPHQVGPTPSPANTPAVQR